MACVVVVDRYPVNRAAWLSNLPHLAAIGILLLAGQAAESPDQASLHAF